MGSTYSFYNCTLKKKNEQPIDTDDSADYRTFNMQEEKKKIEIFELVLSKNVTWLPTHKIVAFPCVPGESQIAYIYQNGTLTTEEGLMAECKPPMVE